MWVSKIYGSYLGLFRKLIKSLNSEAMEENLIILTSGNSDICPQLSSSKIGM